MERPIVEAGPETVAMIIAEPVQNAGGCLVAARRLLGRACASSPTATGSRSWPTRSSPASAASASGSRSARYGAAPDLITVAKGITSAYAPMGAVLVSDRIAEPLYEDGRMLLHGITFGGHPVAAAIALRNLEIFEREGVLENVRAQRGLRSRELLEGIEARCRSSATFAAPGSSGRSSWSATPTTRRFDADEREQLLRGFLPGRLLEEGLIARPDDRGDAVLHLAPPLIADARSSRRSSAPRRARARGRRQAPRARVLGRGLNQLSQ